MYDNDGTDDYVLCRALVMGNVEPSHPCWTGAIDTSYINNVQLDLNWFILVVEKSLLKVPLAAHVLVYNVDDRPAHSVNIYD